MADGAFIVKRYAHDPVAYVREVLGVKQLEDWQLNVLEDLAAGVQRIAVASGHGVGKTALVAWVTHWFNATRPDPQTVVTANTETQLKTKTWREMSKWNARALNGHWFEITATRLYLKASPNTWFASAIPWTEQRSEAFAGTHEEHVLYVFDEASAIADIIWDVSEGAMTSKGSIWLAFGNPTRNTGRFRECWGKFRHRWKTYNVDSRTVSITDKAQIEKWKEDYGEDSDFFKIRVKGEFPNAGTFQFISSNDVDRCMATNLEPSSMLAKVLGIDLARAGDCKNVVATRQGRKVWPLRKWMAADSMQTVSRIVSIIEEENPDAVFMDGGGLGGPIIDRVKQLVNPEIIFEVNGGMPAHDRVRYYNRRAEMWGDMRDAIKGDADLPPDPELKDDLIGPEYSFTNKQQIQLEKKEDMRSRGLASPDSGDAVALTYAEKVIKPRKEDNRAEVYDGEGAWML